MGKLSAGNQVFSYGLALNTTVDFRKNHKRLHVGADRSRGSGPFPCATFLLGYLAHDTAVEDSDSTGADSLGSLLLALGAGQGYTQCFFWEEVWKCRGNEQGGL